MTYRGDIALGATIDFKFTTRRFSTGAPFTLAGSPAVSAYVGNGTTEITAGITLSADFDSRTGLNNVRVVASSGNGYAAGTDVELVITAGTVDGVSVVGEVIGAFSIENRAAGSAIQIADAFLDRDMSLGADSGSPTFRTPRQALRHWRNKVTQAAGVATVTKEDDATASWTYDLITDAAALPIVGVDPAGP